MSQRKPYKHHKKGKESFVKLDSWLLNSNAWRGLTVYSRALYVELKQRYNGNNNGEIFLSHRDTMRALNISRPTVAKYFRELERTGFIKKTQGFCLGTEGRGKASLYALTELSLDGKPPTKEFMKQT